MRENLWYITDRKDNDTAIASHAAEPGSKHVIDCIHVAYSNTKTATVVIKEGTAVKVTLDVVNSLSLDGLGLEFAASSAVSVELAASGTSGVYGSVLISGFTK